MPGRIRGKGVAEKRLRNKFRCNGKTKKAANQGEERRRTTSVNFSQKLYISRGCKKPAARQRLLGSQPTRSMSSSPAAVDCNSSPLIIITPPPLPSTPLHSLSLSRCRLAGARLACRCCIRTTHLDEDPSSSRSSCLYFLFHFFFFSPSNRVVVLCAPDADEECARFYSRSAPFQALFLLFTLLYVVCELFFFFLFFFRWCLSLCWCLLPMGVDYFSIIEWSEI